MRPWQQTSLTASAALALAQRAAASVATFCPSNADGVCFSVAVPESTASSGSGNIYFSMTAPATYQWVALGTGSRMAGSNMFIMYQDGNGNVTLSPRLGLSHAMPTEDTSSTAAQLTLLAGSGVSGNTMTANVMCSNCESWGSGNTLALTSTSAPWIGGWRSGSALDTTRKNVALSEHDGYTQYKLDLTMATVATDSNPFLNATSGSSSSNTTTSDNGAIVSSHESTGALVAAHAGLACLSMVILYPLGSALMPLLGKWIVHGIWQGVAYVFMWCGFALGVIIAQKGNELFTGDGTTHTILGTLVIGALGIQPALGYMHHLHYLKHGGRGFISYFHIWYGRILMVLAIINGGIGLHLSGAEAKVTFGYWVAAIIVFLIYIGGKVYGTRVLAKRRARKNAPYDVMPSPGLGAVGAGAGAMPLESRSKQQMQPNVAYYPSSNSSSANNFGNYGMPPPAPPAAPSYGNYGEQRDAQARYA